MSSDGTRLRLKIKIKFLHGKKLKKEKLLLTLAGRKGLRAISMLLPFYVVSCDMMVIGLKRRKTNVIDAFCLCVGGGGCGIWMGAGCPAHPSATI